MFNFHRFLSRSKSRVRRNSQARNVETLEIRQMPATLVNPMTLTYQDLDGDDVTVKFSQPILTTANVNSIFTFSSGAGAVNASNNAQELLTKLNLTSVTTATPTNITTTAIRSATHGGDGVATLGEINATGKTLGAVILDGDLGRIVALGVKGLTVQSAGRFGAATGATDLNSQIDGNLGALTVKGDFKDVFLSVSGDLGPVAITGSLIGGGNVNAGSISGLKLNSVVIGGDLIGGGVLYSGAIRSATTMGAVTVKGSIRGGDGVASGFIASAGQLGAVVILGGVYGGAGARSGRIESGTLNVSSNLTSVSIGGSLFGGLGSESGAVKSFSGMGNVSIGGDLIGASSSLSASLNGSIDSIGKLGSVMIGGSVIGGFAAYSGQVSAGSSMGVITIKGGVVGGSGVASGAISSFGDLAGVAITGVLSGGAGVASGRLFASGDIGMITISASVIGGIAKYAGSIEAGGKLAGVTIGGSLIGGDGSLTASIASKGNLGPVNIAGNMQGGAGTSSANVVSSLNGIGNVTVGGSITGGAVISSQTDMGAVKVGGSLVGGNFVGSAIISHGKIASVTIGGSIIGGSGNSGYVQAQGEITTITINGDLIGGATLSGYVSAGRINSLTLGGSLIAGPSGSSNGTIFSNNDIGTILIKGNIVGTNTHPAIISARGKGNVAAGAADVAIGSLTVNGRVENALILAGAYSDGGGTNADAQITTVKVLGDWIASSIIAGISAGADFKFGTNDDAKVSGAGPKDDPVSKSKIGSITIVGQAIGTLGGSDSFGFEAQQIGSLKISDAVLPTTAAIDDYFLGITFDFRVREFV